MSTRATVHFQRSGKDEAIVSRHSDGYPAGLGAALDEFLLECQKLQDNRFEDPSYLITHDDGSREQSFATGPPLEALLRALAKFMAWP